MELPTPDLKELDNFLSDHPQINFIRLQWQDYVATVKGRVLTVTHFHNLVSSGKFHEIGRSFSTLPDGSAPWSKNDPTCAVGKLSLVPDLSTIKPVPWNEQHAVVMCCIAEQTYTVELQDSARRDVRASQLCPRAALLAGFRKAEQQNVSTLVGLEIEFVVYEESPSGGVKLGMDTTHQANSIQTLEHRMLPVLDSIVLALTRIGIPVQHYQAEGADQQFEIALAPLPPLAAADAFIVTRDCIRAHFRQHGLLSTLHPCCSNGLTGLHMHISASGFGCREPRHYQAFLAGIMDHLPALCALGMTTPKSYARTRDSGCGCGHWVAWGHQNRQTAVRGISENHWEIKTIDGLSNIYLVIAAYLHCALGGLTAESPLRHGNCLVDPAFMTPHERKELSSDTELPRDVTTALEELQQDEFIRQALGSPLLDLYHANISSYAQFLTKLADIHGASAQVQFLIRRF